MKRSETKKEVKTDSVPRNKVVRYSLEGTVVGHTHAWALNGCSNSYDLGARNVQPQQRTMKRSGPHLKTCSLEPSMIHECHVVDTILVF